MRSTFAASTTDKALAFNYGSWSWSPAKPHPPVSSMLTASLYTEVQFDDVRRHLMAKRYITTVIPGVSQDVLVMQVNDTAGGAARMLRAYNPQQLPNVPSNVAELVIRLAIHHCRPLQTAPEHVHYSAAQGALVVLWGMPNDVQYVSSRMPSTGRALRVLDVRYLVKQSVGIRFDYLCSEYTMRIMGIPDYFRGRVRTSARYLCCIAKILAIASIF